MLQPFLIISGCICVGLGVLGVFLPLLPTTPFLLLAAVCFARSSPRLLRWLTSNRLLGPIIRDYRDGRGMPRARLTFTLMLLWGTIAITIVFFLDQWWARGMIVLIAAIVTVHLLRMRETGDRRA